MPPMSVGSMPRRGSSQRSAEYDGPTRNCGADGTLFLCYICGDPSRSPPTCFEVKMQRQLLVLLYLCLSSVCPGLSDQKQDQGWLPVTQQDWAVKEVPYNPWAPAIQLYFRYYKNDNDSFISAYRRIKVLREAGKKYAYD